MLLTLLLAGCPAGDIIANPTGDCVPDDDGSRTCYHSPEPKDQYLPDCDAPLDRELWRVFAQSADSAYVIPRPDGDARVATLCAGDDAALVALLDQYTLCGTPDIDRINAMLPADALTITHAMHAILSFSAVEQGDAWGIDPWVPDTDLVDACALSQDPALDEVCTMIAGRIEGGTCTDIGYLLDEDAATGLAALLNQLYGVE